jgi:osmoprotectant transport system permease protein
MADFFIHLRAHIVLCIAALAAAGLVAVPLGDLTAHDARIRPFALGLVNAARVVPSLAALTLMLPYLGIGFAPALVALTLLAIPPIVINTDLGLRGVPAAVKEAALGMGMTSAQTRRQVEWPLAVPVAFAGFRTATVEVIASATLAAFIGGGGLGEYIVNGLANNDVRLLLAGGLEVATLALGAELLLGAIQRRLARRLG